MENVTRSPLAAQLQHWASQVKKSRRLQLAWGLSAAWLIAGSVLLFSRLLGAFSSDADSLRALGTILLLNGIVLTLNWLLFNSTGKEATAKEILSENVQWEAPAWAIFSFLGSLAITLAILPRESSLTALLAMGTLLILGFFLADFSLSALCSTSGNQLNELMESTGVDSRVDSADSFSMLPQNDRKQQALKDSQEQLIQWLSRKQDEQGSEIVEGMVRLEFAAGQIQKSAHVAFTPSLPFVPEMECEPLGDAEVEVILGDVYPHGFRVDIRRTDTNRDAIDIEIGFQATCSQPNQNAA